MGRSPLTVVRAAPRGFCAGVERAIAIVEETLVRFGAPVYVRHEIVHNRHVVGGLAAKGAVFVEDLAEVPDGAPVIFSAHGVPKSVVIEAERRGLTSLDATCPLVTKVHREVVRQVQQGRHVLLIGHARHVEVVGTMGQVPPGAVTVVETAADAERVEAPNPLALAYVTQTTLSVDDTSAVIAVLRRRFPGIIGPQREDICYATTNRQEAVKAIARQVDAVLVVGASNSSNTVRLVEVARAHGCRRAHLVESAAVIDWRAIADVRRLGLTSGASAPEVLVEEILDACRQRYDVSTEDVVVAQEDLHFRLPRALIA